MVAAWPFNLPQSPMINGYGEGRGEPRRFSQTDSGPGKLYRKTSAQAKPLKMTLFMDNSQLSIFELFVRDDIDEASLPFTFPNPRGAGDITLRIKENGINWESPNGGLHWYVQLDCEIMP